jgi:hypothetical protein
MGPLHGLDASIVILFSLGALVATAGGVLVSGFLPRAEGPADGRGAAGAVLVYGAVAALVLVVLASLRLAVELPWAVAVVIAGLAILVAPFVVQPLPESVRETRAGLIGVVALSGAVLILLPTFNLT